MQLAIEINSLGVKKGGLEILKSISVDLPRGKIIGLLGPSGAGKTTLMRVIVGRQKITSGKVNVLGLPAGSAVLRSKIGYVTQAESIYKDLTVHENLKYFAAMNGAAKSRVNEVIKEVGLAGHEKQVAGSLSGGQLSRVNLAAVLMNLPELLVMDEPTVGVDPVMRRDLWRRFRALADSGATMIVSSHVMEEASHCDDLLLVRDGKLLTYGTRAEILQKTGTKDVEDAFLKLVEAK